nr:copia protein [Tanacetum cinerariifolium]
MGMKGKVVKPSAYWFWKPSQNLSNKGPKNNSGSSQNNIDDKGYWDSGCSRHITGNISYLSDFEPFDRGYVSFGQGGCKITGKGATKTCKLEFENVYFVKDLKNNLVRGLPTKCFENDHTCSACLKGKQHKASCTKDAASQEVKKNVSSLIYITLPNWAHDALLEYYSSKPQDHCSTEVPEGSGNLNPTASTSNPSADQMETLTVETPIPTVSSPVSTTYSTDSQEPSSDARLISKRVANQVETPSLDNILSLTNWFEDILGVTTNSDESNRVEADICNIETAITASPTPTLRIHKDHPKTRLVAQGHTQEEGIDYDEVFTLVARIEAIRHFLAYASFMGFIVYQIDVKSAFLYGTIDEEVLLEPGDILKKFGYSDVRSSNTSMDKENPWEKTGLEKMLSMPCEALSREFSTSILRFNTIMARLQFCDYHNMVAIFEKSEHNADFHPMVDFIEASPLRIKTTEEGTQILATVDGILITVTESSLRRNIKLQDEEGISSLPDTELFENLTLMGYNISPNQKFTFQKGQFSHQWKYLIYTIMQCISPKSTGFNEFSSNIATALICLATNRTYNFSKMIFDGLVKNVNSKVSKFLMYPRFLTMCLRMTQFGQITHTQKYVVPFHTKKLFTTLWVNSPSFFGRIVPLFDTMLVQQGEGSGTPTKSHHTPSPEEQSPSHTTHTSLALPLVTTTSLPTITQSDTPIMSLHLLCEMSVGEACPTDSGLIADQDRATIDKSSTLPHDSAPRVTSLTADEGTQEVEINKLKERVKMLEDRVAATLSRDDAPIKGRSMDEGKAATERISDDSEEMETVLTSMDAATVLASGVVDVPTGSGSIPTASTPAEEQVPTGSDVVSTASPIFATTTVVTPYRRRKGKEVMVESETPKKQKVQKQIDAQVARELEEELEREDQRRSEQIARDVEIARIHAEEELQIMIDGTDRNNETVAKYLQEYHHLLQSFQLKEE